MIINTAEFKVSNTNVQKCPPPDLPEYAFIGRSNVGKSSLINMLVNKKKLAKTSGKPGKTQLINHFLVNNNWYLVDLPGYGYAKSSKTERAKWSKMIKNYILKRENLMCLFVLIDSRHEAQKIDLEFITFLGENAIPFVLVFTKSDKNSGSQLDKNLSTYKKVLKKTWEELPQIFVSSAEKKTGRDEILDFIDDVNKKFS